MKQIYAVILLACVLPLSYAQTNFYFVDNVRHYWIEDSSSVNIIVRDMGDYDQIVETILELFSDETDTVSYVEDDDNIIIISEKLQKTSLEQLSSSICSNPSDIAFITYAKRVNGRRIWLRNEVYVRLKNETFFSTYLLSFLSDFNDFTLHYDTLEHDYMITCNDEIALMQIANGLYDTLYVDYSTPDFYGELTLNTDDSLFDEQWALNNTGQENGVTGVDIKAEKAWAFLQHYNNNLGDSIRVAVIDNGVESHEDLRDAIGSSRVLQGFPQCCGNGAPNNIGQWHGQACAGIIAASHNSIGVAGIAPNVLIVPIRVTRDIHNITFSYRRIKRAIDFAWKKRDVQILSISWSKTENALLNQALDSAMVKGRGGKGCIIAVSSGNGGSQVQYPATRAGVIAVGAVDRCGKRAGKSNIVTEACDPWPSDNYDDASAYGPKLSVVAPGTKVYTTDRMGIKGHVYGENYTLFNGTSAACPHVAGVAALILSVNPNLTRAQVKEIIEKTAQKVGGYNYSNTDGHPNGTFSDTMGYGMLNAFLALAEAKIYGTEYSISGPSSMELCNEYTYTLSGVVPEGYEIVWETNLHLCVVSGQGTNSLIVRPLYPATGNRVKAKIRFDGEVIKEVETDYIVSTGTGIYPIINQDSVINSNVIWMYERSLGNTVIIDSGAVLTINNTIHCTNNARLIVRPGGKLVVDGGTLTSACAGEMWQGIEVVGDRTKRQIPQWQGKVELRNGAKIENALCGIYAGLRGDTAFATTGGIILADSAYFTNNRRAVEINSYAYTTPSGGIANYVSSFKNCTFTVDDNNLLAANDTVFSEHVKLWEVKGVSFEGCTFLNQTSGLSGKGRGIYAHDAGIVLDVKCNGDGAMAVGLCGCLPEWSDSCLFNGFNTAVEVNTSGTPYAVAVNRVQFRNNTTGVRINGNQFVTVTRNTFNLLTAPGNGSYICGLKLDNSTGYKVEGNRFIGMDSYVPGISRGIWVNNSNSGANRLYRNSFKGLRHGIYATGDNGGQTKYGLQLICNTFNGVDRGIYVESGANISMNQGGPAESASNRFNNGTGFDIVNSGNTGINYYYYGAASPSNPHYPDPVSGLVSLTSSWDTNTCASTLCNNGGWIVNGTGPSLAQFQSSIAGTDDYSIPQGGANGNTAAWQALSDTYHAAVRTLMSGTVLNLNELELWHTAAQPIADPYSLTETRFMEGYAETFTENAENAEMANYAEFHALKLALRDNGADNVGTVEANNYSPLQPDGHVNWYTLTPAQIAQLQTIAERNTGRASVMAKGVLCFFFGICYEDESPLPELRSDKGNTKSGQPQWTYWIIDPMAPVYVPVTYSLLGDTVVDGFSYRISNFHVPSSDRAERPLLVQEDSSGMYYYDHVFHERKLLYPYLAEPGFQYTIYPIFGDTNHLMIVHVDSVAYEDIDNQNVKVLYVSTHDTNYQEPYLHWSFDMSGGMNHAKIIEHIGSTGYFLPVETAYNGFFLVKSLCSYESEDLNYQLVDSVNCNEPYHYSVPQHSASEIRVYPNPAGDLLHIELSGAEIANVALYDLQGRVVTGAGAHAGTPQQDETATVNLRNVPAGVYLLRVRDAEGKEYYSKIVKR